MKFRRSRADSYRKNSPSPVGVWLVFSGDGETQPVLILPEWSALGETILVGSVPRAETRSVSTRLKKIIGSWDFGSRSFFGLASDNRSKFAETECRWFGGRRDKSQLNSSNIRWGDSRVWFWSNESVCR